MSNHVGIELPALLRGELNSAEGAAVGRHLAGCAECLEDLRAIALATGALDELRLLGLEPRQLEPLKAAPQEPARVRRGTGFTPWGWVAVALAAILVAAALGTGVALVRNAGQQRPTATVRLTDVNGSGATGQAEMLGTGNGQQMRVVVSGLHPAPAGTHYEVWLTGPQRSLPLGILGQTGGTYPLPSSLVTGYSAVEVRLQTSNSALAAGTNVLRGSL